MRYVFFAAAAVAALASPAAAQDYPPEVSGPIGEWSRCINRASEAAPVTESPDRVVRNAMQSCLPRQEIMEAAIRQWPGGVRTQEDEILYVIELVRERYTARIRNRRGAAGSPQSNPS